MYTGKRSIK